ncbi:MAG: ketopantoate reductase family protein, partial [Candidatus Eremiobacteraeota bacterium]|nr:ketopantoate reductase family protein [Candidatus Eremiobacteraeota bacterium]
VGTYLGEALRATGAAVAYAPRRAPDVVPVEADLAIVAVKAYDTPDAIDALRAALGPNSAATILSPQNGVGNEELLAAAFGADRIVSGALTVPLERLAGGEVVASNRGGIALAPVGEVAHNWLVAAFERTAIPVRVSDDYRALKWSKLALNIVANAACAILDVTPERLVEFDDMFELEVRGVRETRDVMAKLGLAPVDLPRYPVRALFALVGLPARLARLVLAKRIASARGPKAPSLLLDLRATRGRSEVEVLNGAVAAAGRATGVATPVNEAYARVLAEIAGSPDVWQRYRERPAALLAEVKAREAASFVAALPR